MSFVDQDAVRQLTVGATEALAQFDPEGPRPQRLFASERHVVLLVALEDRQELPAHAPEVDLTLVVTAGDGELLTDTGVRPLQAGDVANVPAGGTRSVRARGGRLIAVAVVSPPPTADDHARPPKVDWSDFADADPPQP